MAAKLNHPVRRETNHREQGRPIIIQLEEGGKLIRFRQKGRRTWHTATVEQCYWAAVKNTAAEEKRERLLKRQERKRKNHEHRL